MSIAFLSAIASSAFAQTVQTNDGFLDQEKPDWIEALPIPAELYPTLAETIRAANLITHEKSLLKISSPTYEQAHRLLLQNLLMMQRQLHLSPADLARFQSTAHPARSTVDPRIYSPNPLGIALPASLPKTLVVTGNSVGFNTYSGDRPSRRSIVLASEALNTMRLSVR